jgi:hypothetical protein
MKNAHVSSRQDVALIFFSSQVITNLPIFDGSGYKTGYKTSYERFITENCAWAEFSPNV